MSEGDNPTFDIDPEIERTFRRRIRQIKQRRSNQTIEENMDAQNNQPQAPQARVRQNADAQEHANNDTNPILLAHDRNRPMREYASPNLYNFASGILQPTFEGNGRFEMKPVMLQILQAAGQFGAM